MVFKLLVAIIFFEKKRMPTLKYLIIFFLISFPIQAFCADDDSKFISITTDMDISGTNATSIISTSVVFNTTKNILIVANGRYFPKNIRGTAIVYIRIDGKGSYRSSSIIEWNTSTNAVQHTLDCMAFVTLTSGSHTIELVGYNGSLISNATFTIGANSGISIVTNPAAYFKNSTLSSDSKIIDLDTYGIGGRGNLPGETLLNNNINSLVQTNVVTLLSGRAYCAGKQGDACWGLYLNDLCPSNNTSNWSVNDIFFEAELHTPMYCFALHNLIGNNTISFKATELSYDAGFPADLVQYRVGQDVRMVSL